MNERLMKYLCSIGLSKSATEQEANEFMLQLQGSQLEFANELFQADDDEHDQEDHDEEEKAEDDDKDMEDDDDDEDEEQESKANSHAFAKAFKRLNMANKIAERHGLPVSWAKQVAQNHKLSMSDIKAKALDMIEKNAPPLNGGGNPSGFGSSGITVGSDRNMDTLSVAIQDAIWSRRHNQGVPVLDDDGQAVYEETEQRSPKGELLRKVKTRRPHDRAREFRGMTMHEMAKAYLNKIGIDTTGMGKVAVSQLVFNRWKMNQLMATKMQAITHTSSDFPAILANIATKTLRTAFTEAPRTWPRWCRRTTLPDFKEAGRMQLGEMPTLRKVIEGGEIKRVTIGDKKQPVTLATFAESFTITWQALINDDLDAFMRIPMLAGNAATRVEEDLVYEVLTGNALADGTTLFSSGNGNLIDGATSGAPSVAQLNAAYALMQNQTGLDGSTLLDIEPAFLIVPSQLRGTALELTTTQIKPGTNDPGGVRNIWEGQLEVISTARLSANSTSQWYLAASPNMIDTIEVAFLEEEQAPVLDEFEGEDVLGRKYRVRHTVAANAIDHRGLLRNNNNA